MNRLLTGALAGALLSFTVLAPAIAKVPQAEADRLGKDLTPMGATRRPMPTARFRPSKAA
ncbi:hypothetical protein [Oleomonas cavernae]|uniref:hypothetical protein n=1 Tax=Oleomonas cavernae TaxID=2320859 RepID=UPI0018F7C861|nr:hypothetical protein [Oleomonas cavernae]